MKKSRISIIFLIAVIVIAFGACGSPQSSTPAPAQQDDPADVPEVKPITLTFAHSYTKDGISGVLNDFLADEITKETNGSVEVIVYPSETLVGLDQGYESVTSGRVDLMDFQISYYTPFMSEFAVLSLPGLVKGDNIPKLVEALTDPVDRYLQQHGMKFICAYGTMESNWFVGNFVVKDPAKDFKGKNVRVSGFVNGEVVTKWGGSPISIGLGDLQTALERGTAAIAMTSWDIIQGFQLYESTPHVTASNMAEAFCGVVMNLDVWNSLTKEQQDGILRAGKTFETEGFKVGAEVQKEFIAKLQDSGVEFHKSSDADFEFFHKSAMEILNENYAERSDTVKEFLEAINKLL